MVARFTTSTEALGTGMELTTIAAAVIGGVSLAGGTGSMFGPLIGAFLLGGILLGLTLLGVSQFVQQIITGVILLAAVSNDRLLVHRAAAEACKLSLRGQTEWPSRPSFEAGPEQGLWNLDCTEQHRLHTHAG